jgi:hypothetical protein
MCELVTEPTMTTFSTIPVEKKKNPLILFFNVMRRAVQLRASFLCLRKRRVLFERHDVRYRTAE